MTQCRILSVHETWGGPQVSCTDRMRHCVSICKRTAWAVWESFPELTNVLSEVNDQQTDIPESCMSTIARFVILMYDRTSTCNDINTARRKLFAMKGRPLESIPPTHSGAS